MVEYKSPKQMWTPQSKRSESEIWEIGDCTG